MQNNQTANKANETNCDLHLPSFSYKLPWSKAEQTFFVMASKDGSIIAESDWQLCKFDKTGEGVVFNRKAIIRQFPPEFVQKALSVCEAIDGFCVM